mgnify:CR=1 FL=1
MGCNYHKINLGDGIFDKLSSEEVIEIIWKDIRNNEKLNIHSLLS